MTPASTAFDTKQKALCDLAVRDANEHLKRCELRAEAEYVGSVSCEYEIPASFPKVTLIIPTRNGRTSWRSCFKHFELTTYPNYDIIIVDNGSDDARIIDYFDELRQIGNIQVKNVTTVRSIIAINNAALPLLRVDYWARNNDIEVSLLTGWLKC